MLQDLWIKHRDWVFEPIYYSSVEALIGALDEKIIKPAEARFLLARKAEKMKGDAGPRAASSRDQACICSRM
jgi:hypothetical protein